MKTKSEAVEKDLKNHCGNCCEICTRNHKKADCIHNIPLNGITLRYCEFEWIHDDDNGFLDDIDSLREYGELVMDIQTYKLGMPEGIRKKEQSCDCDSNQTRIEKRGGLTNACHIENDDGRKS